MTFSFGKHKGKAFEDVFGSDKGYCAWVSKLDSCTGQMLEFRNFVLAKGGGSSQGSPESPWPPAQRAAANPWPAAQTPQSCRAPGGTQATQTAAQTAAQTAVPADFRLCLELMSPSTFRVKSASRAYVPPEVWRKLTNLKGLQLGESKRDWFGLMSEYQEVLGILRTDPLLLLCRVEMIPAWTHRAIEESRKEHSNTSEAQRQLDTFVAALPEDLLSSRPLMEFQKEGIIFGLSRGGRCLFGDEMGLGKTLQALVVAAHYQDEWPMIVVVPSALRLVWREQALSWLPHLIQPHEIQVLEKSKQKLEHSAQIVIVSYDLLARCRAFQERADSGAYKVVIVDEAHYIKSAGAKRTEAVMGLARRARRCIMISGTPAVNHAEDLYTQVCGLLGKHAPTSKTAFCERYCEKRTMFVRGASIVKYDGARCKEELFTLLTNTIMIRRLKNDVLTQLPAKRRQRIILTADKLDKARMKELAGELAKREEGDDGFTGSTNLFKITAEAKVAAVQEYVDYLLGNSLKFLIFAHHHIMLDALESKVSASNVRYIRIDGKTASEQRQKSVAQFQEDKETRVAILSLTACGQGLTLTAAHTVVFAELYWVPGQLIQAEDRVHRIGQTSCVDIHYLVAPNSLDDAIFRMINRKHDSITKVLDGVKKHMDLKYVQQDLLHGPGGSRIESAFDAAAQSAVTTDAAANAELLCKAAEGPSTVTAQPQEAPALSTPAAKRRRASAKSPIVQLGLGRFFAQRPMVPATAATAEGLHWDPIEEPAKQAPPSAAAVSAERQRQARSAAETLSRGQGVWPSEARPGAVWPAAFAAPMPARAAAPVPMDLEDNRTASCAICKLDLPCPCGDENSINDDDLAAVCTDVRTFF